MEKRSMGHWFYLMLVVLMGLMCFLFWKQITVPVLSENLPYYSDMPPYMTEGVEAKTELWYALVGPLIFLFYRITGTTSGTAFLFALSLACCQGATVLMVRRWYCMRYNKASTMRIELLSLASVFVTMMFSPFAVWGETGWWYRQSLSPNVWHNPTTMLCRPFSLWVIFCIYQAFLAYKNGQSAKKYLWLNALAAFLSMWAKPSFLAAFLPALCLYLLVLLIRTKGQSFMFSLKLGVSFLPSMSVLIYQYAQLYFLPVAQESESGICLGVSQTVFGILHSIVMSSGFVLLGFFVLVFFCKRIKPIWGFCLLWYTIAWSESLFLQESGVRAGHGNFGWAVVLTLFCLFVFVAGELFFAREKYRIPKFCIYPVGVVYGIHLVTGILYFGKILLGGSYY